MEEEKGWRKEVVGRENLLANEGKTAKEIKKRAKNQPISQSLRATKGAMEDNKFLYSEKLKEWDQEMLLLSSLLLHYDFSCIGAKVQLYHLL